MSTVTTGPVYPHCLSFQSHSELAVIRQRSRRARTDALASEGKDILAACTTGDVELMKRLIADGGDIKVLDEHGNTPLHIAAGDGDLPMVEVLLPVTDLTTTNKLGYSALHVAIYWQNLDVALRLLESGAEVNAIDNDGELPIHFAVRNEDIVCVRLLIAAKSCATMPNEKGTSALELATSNKFTQIMEVLEGPLPTMPLSKRKRDERATLMELNKGDTLIYKKTERVTVVAVHLNDSDPYCTIKMPDGSERQTTPAHIEIPKPDPSERKAKRLKSSAASTGNSSVYVSGLLPEDANEEFVRSLFSPFGDVTNVKLYRNQWGKPKGDALVSLGSNGEGRAAIKALNGKEVRPGVPITASGADFNKPKAKAATAPAAPIAAAAPVNMFGNVALPNLAFAMPNRQMDLASKSAAIAKEVEALKAMLGK